MFNYGHGIAGYVLILIATIHGAVACIVSLVVIAVIIYHKTHHRLKQEEKIIFLLSAQIYLFILIYMGILFSNNIQTLLGDTYGNDFNSPGCVFIGYWNLVAVCAIYYSFVVQAIFRLCRIVYSNYRWLRSYWIFVLSVPFVVILANAFVCPVLFWHDVVYIPDERYCYILLTNHRVMVWLMFAIYVLPVTYLLIIYVRIMLFLRHQTNNLAVSVQRRQQRDLVAIQRIFIKVGLLLSMAFPGTVVWMVWLFTGMLHPLNQRILWIGEEVSVAVLSILMVFMTPQLKNIFVRNWRRNRVEPTGPMIQMRTVVTAH